VFEWGENAADAYAELGPYEVVELDGTYTDFIRQLRAATAEPMGEKGQPNVIVIDSATVLWDALKDWTTTRAMRSKANQKKLREDPDAEIIVSNSYWNDANDRWGKMLHILDRWPGIAVMCARGKEVARIGKDGNPVSGETEYRVEAQKNLPFVAAAQVRCDGPRRTRLVAVTHLHADVGRDGLVLPEDAPLEHVVFTVMGAGQPFARSTRTEPQMSNGVVWAKNELVRLFVEAGWSDDEARGAAADVWRNGPCPDRSKDDDVSDDDWAALEEAARARLAAKDEGEAA